MRLGWNFNFSYNVFWNVFLSWLISSELEWRCLFLPPIDWATSAAEMPRDLQKLSAFSSWKQNAISYHVFDLWYFLGFCAIQNFKVCTFSTLFFARKNKTLIRLAVLTHSGLGKAPGRPHRSRLHKSRKEAQFHGPPMTRKHAFITCEFICRGGWYNCKQNHKGDKTKLFRIKILQNKPRCDDLQWLL